MRLKEEEVGHAKNQILGSFLYFMSGKARKQVEAEDKPED